MKFPYEKGGGRYPLRSIVVQKIVNWDPFTKLLITDGNRERLQKRIKM